MLIEGNHLRYKQLFIKINTDAGTKTIVAPLYSPNRDTKEIQVGTNLTYIILARASVWTNDSNNVISELTLYRQAVETFKNGKKALAYANEFLDSGGHLPSGKNVSDLLEHVVKEMWIDLNKNTNKKNTVVIDTTTTTTTTKTKGRPKNWVFKGYVAFCLFACPIITNENERLAHFTTGGELEGPNATRVAARKVIKEENKKKRSFEAIEYRDRGRTIEEEISIRTIRANEASTIQESLAGERKKFDGAMVIFESTLSNLLKRREQALKLFDTFKPHNKVKAENYLKEIENVEVKIEDIEKKKTETRKLSATFETTVGRQWTSTLHNLLSKRSPNETRDLCTFPKTVETNQNQTAALDAGDVASVDSNDTEEIVKDLDKSGKSLKELRNINSRGEGTEAETEQQEKVQKRRGRHENSEGEY